MKSVGTQEDALIGNVKVPESLPLPTASGYRFAGWYTDTNLTTEVVVGTALTENITLYAKWVKQVVLTINYGYDIANKTESYDINTVINVILDPARQGYRFDGWYTSNEYTEKFDFTKELSQDTTIYAKWIEQFNVTINGTTIAYDINSKIEEPSHENKEGYRFDGWYNGDAKWNFESDTVTSNIELEAKYIQIYTITFKNNDGTELQTGKYDVNSNYPTAPKASKEGYTFKCWTFEDGSEITDIAALKVIKDRVITAKYYDKVTVIFYSNGGSEVSSSTIDEQTKVTKPENPTRVGYTFAGWYIGEEEFNFNNEIAHNITLTAKWTHNKYTITFVTGIDDLSVDKVENAEGIIYADLETFANADIVKSGEYTFDGWYFEEDYTSKVTENVDLISNVTLYAKFVITSYGEFMSQDGVIYGNHFNDTEESIIDKNNTDLTTIPNYQWVGVNSDGAFDNKHKVTISNGKLNVIDTGSNTTYAYIYTDAKYASTIDIETTISIGNIGTKWNIFTVVDSNGKDILSIGTVSEKKLTLTQNSESISNSVDVSTGKDFNIKLSINLLSREVSATLTQDNNSFVLTGKLAEAEDVYTFGGVYFKTAGKAPDRSINCDYIAIRSYNEDLDALKNIYNEKLDSIYNEKNESEKYTINVQSLKDAYESAIVNINNQDSAINIIDAYNTGLSSLEAILNDDEQSLQNAKDAALTKIDEIYNANKDNYTIEYTTSDEDKYINKKAFDDLYNSYKELINNALKVEDLTDIDTKYTTAISEIKDDSIILTEFREYMSNGLKEYIEKSGTYTINDAEYEFVIIESNKSKIDTIVNDFSDEIESADKKTIKETYDNTVKLVDNVDNDEAIINNAKAAAKAKLNEYATNAKTDKTDDIIAKIVTAYESGITNIEAASDLTNINAAYTAAKTAIDGASSTIDQYKEQVKTNLVNYVDTVISENKLTAENDQEVIAKLEAYKEKSFDGCTTNDEVDAKYNEFKNAIDNEINIDKLAKYKKTKLSELEAYITELIKKNELTEENDGKVITNLNKVKDSVDFSSCNDTKSVDDFYQDYKDELDDIISADSLSKLKTNKLATLTEKVETYIKKLDAEADKDFIDDLRALVPTTLFVDCETEEAVHSKSKEVDAKIDELTAAKDLEIYKSEQASNIEKYRNDESINDTNLNEKLTSLRTIDFTDCKDKDAVDDAVTNRKAEIDLLFTKDITITGLIQEYSNIEDKTFYNETLSNAYNEYKLTALEEQKDVIRKFEETEENKFNSNTSTYLEALNKALEAKYNELASTEFELTYTLTDYAGKEYTEVVSVVYGTSIDEIIEKGLLHITGMKATSATLTANGTNDSTEYVYDSTTATIDKVDDIGEDNLITNINWKLTAEDTTPSDKTTTVISNELFKLDSSDSSWSYAIDTNETKISDSGYGNAFQSSNVASAVSQTVLTFTIKENLSKLKLVVGYADSKYSGKRKGTLNVKLNNEIKFTKTEDSTSKPIYTVDLTSVNFGDIITIELSGMNSGSRLYLFEVDATLETSVVPKLVTTKWIYSEGESNTQYYSYLDAIGLLENNDTKFDYWYYLDSNGDEVKLNGNEKFSSYSNIEIQAKYKEANVHITYNVDGIETIKDYLVEDENGIVCDMEDPIKDGHKFMGWYTDEACTEGNEFDFTSVRADNDYTLYAKFKVAYTISFDTKFDDIKIDDIKDVDKLIYEDLKELTKEGYAFKGWYFEKEDQENKITEDIDLVGNLEVYAKWTKLYIVDFNDTDLDDIEVEEETFITKPETPSKTGYEFIGWYTSADFDTEFDFENTPINANTSIYVKWEKLVSITIDYNYDSKTDTIYVKSGNSISLSDPERNGYNFGGWYTNADCTDEFDLNTVFTLESEMTTIYAKWEEAASATYTISADDYTSGLKKNTSYSICNGAIAFESNADMSYVESGNAIQNSANNKTFTISANKNVQMKLVVSSGNSSGLANQNGTYTLTYSNGTTATCSANKSKIEITIELDENESVVIKCNKRIDLYSITATVYD